MMSKVTHESPLRARVLARAAQEPPAPMAVAQAAVEPRAAHLAEQLARVPGRDLAEMRATLEAVQVSAARRSLGWTVAGLGGFAAGLGLLYATGGLAAGAAALASLAFSGMKARGATTQAFDAAGLGVRLEVVGAALTRDG